MDGGGEVLQNVSDGDINDVGNTEGGFFSRYENKESQVEDTSELSEMSCGDQGLLDGLNPNTEGDIGEAPSISDASEQGASVKLESEGPLKLLLDPDEIEYEGPGENTEREVEGQEHQTGKDSEAFSSAQDGLEHGLGETLSDTSQRKGEAHNQVEHEPEVEVQLNESDSASGNLEQQAVDDKKPEQGVLAEVEPDLCEQNTTEAKEASEISLNEDFGAHLEAKEFSLVNEAGEVERSSHDENPTGEPQKPNGQALGDNKEPQEAVLVDGETEEQSIADEGEEFPMVNEAGAVESFALEGNTTQERQEQSMVDGSELISQHEKEEESSLSRENLAEPRQEHILDGATSLWVEKLPAIENDVLSKEPSLSTPAMEVLIDADNEGSSHEEDGLVVITDGSFADVPRVKVGILNDANELQKETIGVFDNEDVISYEVRRESIGADGQDAAEERMEGCEQGGEVKALCLDKEDLGTNEEISEELESRDQEPATEMDQNGMEEEPQGMEEEPDTGLPLELNLRIMEQHCFNKQENADEQEPDPDAKDKLVLMNTTSSLVEPNMKEEIMKPEERDAPFKVDENGMSVEAEWSSRENTLPEAKEDSGSLNIADKVTENVADEQDETSERQCLDAVTGKQFDEILSVCASNNGESRNGDGELESYIGESSNGDGNMESFEQFEAPREVASIAQVSERTDSEDERFFKVLPWALGEDCHEGLSCKPVLESGNGDLDNGEPRVDDGKLKVTCNGLVTPPTVPQLEDLPTYNIADTPEVDYGEPRVDDGKLKATCNGLVTPPTVPQLEDLPTYNIADTPEVDTNAIELENGISNALEAPKNDSHGPMDVMVVGRALPKAQELYQEGNQEALLQHVNESALQRVVTEKLPEKVDGRIVHATRVRNWRLPGCCGILDLLLVRRRD